MAAFANCWLYDVRNRRHILAAALATALAAGVLQGSTGPAEPPGAPAPRAAEQAPATAQGVDQALAELTRQEREATRRLDQLAQQARALEAATIAYGRAYVRKSRTGLLPVGGGFQALVDHASELERLRHAVARSQRLQRQLGRRRAALLNKVGTLRSRRGQLEVQRRALADARTALLAAQDRELAFRRAFSSSGPLPHTAIYGPGLGPSDPSVPSTGFAGMKGRLLFPLPGRMEVLATNRAGAYGRGLTMRAPLGSPVRAVYPGRVAFADRYADYGKTVIIDHGDRYYSLSANLNDIGVSAGDELTAGAHIGTVGDSGTGPALYFELRHGVEAVDAAPWFGI